MYINNVIASFKKKNKNIKIICIGMDNFLTKSKLMKLLFPPQLFISFSSLLKYYFWEKSLSLSLSLSLSPIEPPPKFYVVWATSQILCCVWLGWKKEMKVKPFIMWLKGQKKENGGGWGFSPMPTFFFLPKIERKWVRKWH